MTFFKLSLQNYTSLVNSSFIITSLIYNYDLKLEEQTTLLSTWYQAFIVNNEIKVWPQTYIYIYGAIDISLIYSCIQIG